jgi:hypothetical protein
LTSVVEAEPLIVSEASTTCFKSIKIEVFAFTDTSDSIATSSSNIDAVTAEVVVLVTPMLVTTAVAVAGVVYSVVLVVAAAPLKRALDVTAISYCILS